MDLYRLLGVSLDADTSAADWAGFADDPEPRPWTLLTKVVETTDEAGLIAAFGRVAP